MKNHELLDIIGDVNEDYVLAADSSAARPRSRWKAWAACAACAALALGIGLSRQPDRTVRSLAGTSSEAVHGADSMETAPAPEPTLVEAPGLHPYTLVEGGLQIRTTVGGTGTVPLVPYAPGAGVEDCLNPSETGLPIDREQGGDVPVQEEANRQCEHLYQWLFGTTFAYPDQRYPEWFGGVWLDNGYFPEARLAIAIVDSFHTAGLEDQIRERCGGTGEILFPGVKYSRNQLVELMEKITQTFDELNCRSYLSYGLDEMENRVGLNFSDTPSGEVLAALAELDPDGDAIFIQVFVGVHVVPTDEAEKGPAPESVSTPVAEDERSFPAEESAVPGGVTEPAADPGAAPDAGETSMPVYRENSQPAQYHVIPPGTAVELPQAKYDVIYGTEG